MQEIGAASASPFMIALVINLRTAKALGLTIPLGPCQKPQCLGTGHESEACPDGD
jgi:hypothetical protein